MLIFILVLSTVIHGLRNALLATLGDLPTLKLKNYKGWDGIVISHGTSKHHKASTVTWQRPSKAELHDVCHATFGFELHILYAWETFNICTIGDIGMMEIFLSLIFAFPQEHCFPQENPGMLPLPLLVIFLSIWRSSLYLESCDEHLEARDLSMAVWDIITSIPVLALEQDNQKKVNFKRYTWFGGLEELATAHITSLFLLYTQAIPWHIQQQR